MAQPSFPRWSSFGFPGSDIVALRSDPDVPGRIFVLNGYGQAFVSADSGAHWALGGRVPCGDQDTPRLREAHGWGGHVFALCRASIWRSRDRAMTWERFSPAMPGPDFTVVDMALTATGAAVVTVGGACGRILVTRDDGRTWLSRDCHETRIPERVAADRSGPGRLVGVTSAPGPETPAGAMPYLTTLSSDDGGLEWRVVSSRTDSRYACIPRSLAIDASGTAMLTTGCGSFASGDGGRTWRSLPTPAGVMGEVRAHPSVAGRFLAQGPYQLALSTNAGASWTPLPYTAGVREDFDFDASGEGVLGAGSGGPYRLGPGELAWTPMNEGIFRPLAVVAASEDASILLGSADGVLVRSQDGGATWIAMYADAWGFFRPLIPVPGKPGTTYAIARPGPGVNAEVLLRSADGGLSWSTLPVSLSGPGGRVVEDIQVDADEVLYGRTNEYRCDPFHGVFCVLVSSRLVRLDAVAGGWVFIDEAVGVETLDAEVSPARRGVIVASTTKGLLASDSAGAAWRVIWDRELRGAWDEYELDRTDSRLLYVRAGRLVWASDDAGITWRTGGPIDASGRRLRLVADPRSRGRAFLGNGDGAVWETRDAGRSWARVALPDAVHDGGTYLSSAIGVRDGSRILFGVATRAAMRLELRESGELLVGSGLWGLGAEPGWGLSITQHASGQVFGVLYAFSPDGRPTWQVMPGGQWLDDRTFRGEMYATTGPGFFAAHVDAGAVVIGHSGAATIRFVDRDRAVLTLETPDGGRIESPIERLFFGPPDPTPRADVGDMWWDPRESGWGLAIAQQYGKLFATWFIHDDEGRPLWLALPDGEWSPSSDGERYSGTVYRAKGRPLAEPYEASAFGVTPVGTATLTFLPQGDAVLAYAVAGQTGSRLVRRQAY